MLLICPHLSIGWVNAETVHFTDVLTRVGGNLFFLYYSFFRAWGAKERELRTCLMEETCGQRVPARWVELPTPLVLKKKKY